MTERPSDTLLNGLNRILDAKRTGALNKDELSKEIILAGDIYSNGLKYNRVEGDPESFKSFIPNGNIFNYKHAGLDIAAKTVDQAIGAAEMGKDAKEETASYQKVYSNN